MNTVSVMVVLPTLGDRLESLALALESCATFPAHIEPTIVVVVPEGATPARQLALRHRAIVINDPGSGMADAINAAIATREDEKYYIWVGDDDVLVGEGIAAAVEELERTPAGVVAYGHCEYIDDAGRVLGKNSAGNIAQLLVPWGPNLIPHPGTVVSIDAIASAGGFDSELSYALDLDLFLRLRRQGLFLHVKHTTAQFRWHAESLTVADRRASSREAMKVKASYLPNWLKPVAPLWQWPVAWASTVAARQVSRRAAKNGSLET
jgi:GT2 family glycosyltransferase